MTLPQDPMAAARLVMQATRQGDDAAAIQLASDALTQFADHPFVLRAASEVHLNIQNFSRATELAEAAARIMPGDPGAFLHLASCYAGADKEDKAVDAARSAARLAPANAFVLSHVGMMLSRLDENEDAKALFLSALRLNPNNAQDHYNLATVEQMLGDLSGAEQSCDRALELDPKLYEVHFVRSRLRKQTQDNNHINELEAARRVGGKLPLEHAMVCYALAKEYEDLAEYASSFAALKDGADTYRASIQYDVQSDTNHMDLIIRSFGSDVCGDTGRGNTSEAPIFVLGLPRSGTTLVERIFASHSQVVSAGELPNFFVQMRRLCRALADSDLEVDVATQALKLEPSALGERYLQSVPERYQRLDKFVDKLPANFLYIGHVRRSLPNATIVELQRHPMDSCYAMYKMLFNRIYPASYNLNDLADYYIHYRRLMDHWRDQFGDAITTVRYDEVVADQEAQSRRLLEAAGLGWQDQVLEFHKSKSASATASAAQVRSPVYSSSVQLWRQYENELAPLAERLQKAGIDIS